MCQKDINALEKFIENYSTPQKLDVTQSKNNLEKSLVEIISKNKNHLSNGILITSNGYFLTSAHCVEDIKKNNIRIRDYKNKTYKISKICEKNKKEDLALVKANIYASPSHRKYNLIKINLLKKYYPIGVFPINLKTRWNGKIENDYGYLIYKEISFFRDDGGRLHQFGCLLHSKPGDSGGIIISPQGELMGLHNSSNPESYSLQSKIDSGIELIEIHLNKLKKNKKFSNIRDSINNLKKFASDFFLKNYEIDEK